MFKSGKNIENLLDTKLESPLRKDSHISTSFHSLVHCNHKPQHILSGFYETIQHKVLNYKKGEK